MTASDVQVPFDPDVTPEQASVLDALRVVLNRRADMAAVRAAEPRGEDPALWSELVSFGVLDMALPVGDRAGLQVSSLCCEVLGEFAALVPAAESVSALRLLDRLSSPPAKGLLETATSRGGRVTLACRPPLAGKVAAVPGGSAAETVLFLSQGRTMAVTGTPGQPRANIGGLPLCDWTTDGAAEIADAEGESEFRLAVAEWKVLTAAYLVGCATRCLAIGIEYTTTRHAFGRPVAAFQSVAHRLADDATQLDAARLLVRQAAWGLDVGAEQRLVWASMATVLAAEAAEQLATDVLHYHGGYGVTLEYDIQLYFRRIKGLILQLGDPADEVSLLADLQWPRQGQA